MIRTIKFRDCKLYSSESRTSWIITSVCLFSISILDQEATSLPTKKLMWHMTSSLEVTILSFLVIIFYSFLCFSGAEGIRTVFVFVVFVAVGVVIGGDGVVIGGDGVVIGGDGVVIGGDGV